jgi:AcrR family transcriptional regulator
VTEPVGRRERKKAATRQALADAALELFLARGFDKVGVREIAEAADVSTGTLFKHFPTKESLVFDQGGDREAALVAAVRERPAGQSVLAALHDYVLAKSSPSAPGDNRIAQFRTLIEESEVLQECSRRMWLRQEKALAQAIADEMGGRVDATTCTVLAHFALEARQLVYGEPEPSVVVNKIFALLEGGWKQFEAP